jgi:drug/metabolite transporter (DMT)-like permease
VKHESVARLEVLAAALLFSGGGAGIKACSLTSFQVASFRSGVAVLLIWLLVREARAFPGLRALLVGVAQAVTLVLFVLANKLTTSANTIFLQSTAPVYILLLGPWLLRERIRRADLGILAIALLGLAMFFVGAEAPRITAPDPVRGNFLALLAGVSWALTLIGLRWLGRGSGSDGGPQSGAVAVLAGNLLAFLVMLPLALPVGAARPVDWLLIAGLGILQIGLAYKFLTAAFRHVPALEASLILLIEPVLNPIWAWLFHGERPGAWPLLGGVLILAAATLKTWIDTRPTSGD